MQLLSVKGIDLDTRTLTCKGIVDYGGELSIMVPNGLADQILVFVFWPLLAKWIKPFAWLGTKEGVAGTVLVELIINAFACLYHYGAIAKRVVYDGKQANKSMMKQF